MSINTQTIYHGFPLYKSDLSNMDEIYMFYFNEYVKLINEWQRLMIVPSNDVTEFNWSEHTPRYLHLQTMLQSLIYSYSNIIEQFIMFKLKWDYVFKIPVNTFVSFTIPGLKYPIAILVQHTDDRPLEYDDENCFHYIDFPVAGLPKGSIITFYSMSTEQYHREPLDSYVIGI